MTVRTTYDEVRYSNFPYAQTHPDRLATVAALHGLSTPDPSTARVLELGCGAGGNLIAMAVATPGISALGVDLAAGPIAEGRETIEAVGLRNIELRQGDITQLRDGGLGEFDFVIAHGVYAWIPEPVRLDLLAAIHSHLAADGIAFVSYNAHPGGYMRRALRDAGLWFASGIDDPIERAGRARELYEFLWANRAGTEDWWGGLLESQLDAFAHGPLYRLVHDELGEFWAPVWFADFARRAAEAGLAYVGDADLTNLLPGRIPEALVGDLERFSGDDRIGREQVIDILRCVFFRQSVLCRDSRTASDEAVVDALGSLHYATRPGTPVGEPAAGPTGSSPREPSAGPTGSSPREPSAGLLGSVLALLRSREPDTVAFADLRAATGSDYDELCEALREGFLAELVMPHRTPLRAIRVADVERPVASPLARWQAGRQSEVTSMAYTNVHMEEPAARVLLELLDGTRDRDAIRAEFQERTGIPITPQDLDTNLDALAKLFLLTA